MMGAAAFVLVTATAAFAQAPNFSGTWVRDMPAAGAAAGGGGGGGGRQGGGGGGVFACGAECTIVQDGKTLTIKRPAGQSGQAPADVVLTLVGESKLMQPGRQGGEPTPYTATAKWDGAKWVVTRTFDMQGTSITSTQTVSLEGGKLTVVTTSSRDGATPQTATYTKK
jgi:hypothetical protein